MPRRRLSFLWLVPLLVAASCSGGNGGGDDGNGTAGGELKGQQVEVAATWSGTDQQRFAAVLAKFEERTGATVKFTSTGDDIATALRARVDAGKPPDVALLPQARLLGDLASRGVLKPLPSSVADLVARNYAPVWQELGTVNGRLFGVWFRAVNKSTLWFNRKALEGAGVTQPPATWDELKAAATALSRAGVPPFSVGAAEGRILTDWFENVYLRTAGTDHYIDLARHQLAWDDTTVIAALARLGEIFRSEWLAGGAPGALKTDVPTSVAAVFADPPKAGFVLEANPADPDEDAGVVEFPSIAGSPPSAVVGGDAAVLLADTPGGRALVEFLATPEAAEAWAGLGGFTSPNKSLDVATYRNDVDRRSAEALLGAEVVRFDMSDLEPAEFGADPDQGLWPLFQRYLADPASGPDVAMTLERVATGIFEP
jgi:ABC-type glycerol-3-phosphate transport system substrate-binding protein